MDARKAAITAKRRPHLASIFAPKNVAVIGATENVGSVGRTVFWNLLRNPFGGSVFPVNPKRASVLGVKAYPSVSALPEAVDLAVIATPAPTVPGIIDQCSAAGIPGAIVISAGFKELGATGVELERRTLENARKGNMRIVGPNCLGVMSPTTGLNATFAAGMAAKGSVAFLSQSGALCTAILDWSMQESVGFSAFVSTGSMLDVGWGDLIDYFGDDANTRSILIYMESIGDARSFLSAAREVALSKPIIVIKAGRTDAAARAAASHTGALTGADDVLDAAFKRAGVLRVDRISDLFYMAEVLSKQPRTSGKRLTIVTNAGGPGVLATDALIQGGGELSPVTSETFANLNAFLPEHWSRNNPIDILGDAGADRYAKSLDIVAASPDTDGLLAILTPQDMTDATGTAELLASTAKKFNKPILASWMGGPIVAEGNRILNKAGIPTFEYPDSAARAFNYMWRYSSNLTALYETPSLVPSDKIDYAAAEECIRATRDAGRDLLTEYDSKRLLAAYGIPTVTTLLADTADKAVEAAQKIGFPVVLKLHSLTITHKTDVGGVVLNLQDAGAVSKAFEQIRASVTEKAGAQHFQGVTVQAMAKLPDATEIIVGSSMDPQFGPVVLFGAGGQFVEVYKDRALGLPPLTTTLARRMIEQTKLHTILKGARGRKPADIAAIEQLLVRFSQLVVEQRWIKEIDINPLWVTHDRLVALDARVVLHPAGTPESQLPRPSIRPYPTQYKADCKLDDGTALTLRPIRPEDESLMPEFHKMLSEESVRFRYFHSLKLDARTNHERLVRVCLSDYDRQIAIVAERRDAARGGAPQIIGVARLVRLPDPGRAEFAIVVADPWHRKGVGRQLMQTLLNVARGEKIDHITADILGDNLQMQNLARKLGFDLRQNPGDGTVKAELKLST